MFNTNPWLYYSTTSNKLTNTYIQGILDICGNIVLRNGGFSLPNGDVSMNGNLYVGMDSTMKGNVNIQGNLVVNKRVLQTLSNDPSYNTVNGYYALVDNVQPIVSRQTAYDIGQNWVNAVSGVIGVASGDNQWTSLCWSPELGLFCSVAQTGNTNQRVMVSSDGLNWLNAITVSSSSNWVSVCWSPKLGLFCAVGYSTGTTIQRVIVSSDGLNWTNAIDGVLTNDWLSVCWSPELELFCAVAYSGTTNQRVMISRNGYNWTSAIDGVLELDWREICWSPELGLFCAVASSGTTNQRVMVSSDGLRWRNATTGVLGNDWYGVCWSPELGLFCAVANNGTTNQRVMVSSDGLNWRNATSGVLDLVWNSVCWAPQLGLFCAVATTGTTNQRVMVSRDGLNWSNATSGVLNGSWYRVCWSPELSSFCAIDIFVGTTNQRVMITNPIYRLPTTKSIKTLVNDGNYNINVSSTSSGNFPNFRSTATGPNLISIGNGNYKSVAGALRDSIVIGNTILNTNPTGYGIIGMGQNVFPALTTGFQNIGIGNAIATSMTTGYNNVFIGNSVATSTTSTGNTVAIGTNAGRTNTTGINNTYLGAFTDANATGYNNSTALGFGATITSSNQIKLGTTGNVDISGNLNVTGLTSLFGYFTTNVIGLSYIRGAASNATITAGTIMQIGTTAGYDTMLFNTVGTSLSGSVFTAPITGYYFIYASAQVIASIPGFAIRLNATSSTTGTEIGGNYTLAANGGLTASSTLIRRLTAGETISFYSKGCNIFSRATGLSGSNCIIYLLFAN
jgi:hypothetical protein